MYEDNHASEREVLWNELGSLRNTYDNLEWVMSGVHNEVRVPEERNGQGTFDQNGADTFNAVVFGLHELDSIGGLFNQCIRTNSQ